VLMDIADDVMDVRFSADAGMVFGASDDLNTAYISAGDCMRLTVNGVERNGNREMLSSRYRQPFAGLNRWKENAVQAWSSHPMKSHAYICNRF